MEHRQRVAGSRRAAGSGRATAAAALVLLAAVGCAEGGPPGGGETPSIFVSVPPQAWFVERIAPAGVEVEVMIPPGASPRTYEPTIRQMRRLSEARLYLALGHPGFLFERTWLPRIVEREPGLRIVRTGERCERIPDDPHLWLAPSCAREMARRIAEAVSRAVPEERRAAERRLDGVLASIDSVDARVRGRLEPHRGRAFLVFHPAWGYFARAYGLRQVAVEVEGKHPSPGELGAIVERAREEGIRAIFVQPQFSRESARTVAREIGAEIRVLDPLAREWPESLLTAADVLDRAFRTASPGAASSPDPGRAGSARATSRPGGSGPPPTGRGRDRP